MRISAYANGEEPRARRAPEADPAGDPIRVLMFYDEPGWAWWHRAHHVRKSVSPAVRIEVAQLGRPFDHHAFDFLLLFDAQLMGHVRHVPREKIVLGSSCPLLTPGAVRILAEEKCAAGLVNSREAYEAVKGSGLFYCCQNGVDEELFRPAASPPDRWIACWVGNSKSIGNKGLDLIREACARAGVELLAWDKAALSGPDALLTQEQVRDRVYHRASFFICASESEGTPNPMLEALACGLPVVTTAVGNAPELIREGYNGFLAGRSVAGLEEGIRRLLGCDRAALSRQARASILDGWTWKLQAPKYEAAFRDLRNRARKRPGNPKDDYRHILWVDVAPRPQSWDPAPMLAALRARYPAAAVSACCDRSRMPAYAGIPGLRSVQPVDAEGAAADPAIRASILQRLQALDIDLAVNATAQPSFLSDVLALGSTICERVGSRAAFEALPAPMRTELRPFYTRLAPTDPDLLGSPEHVWALLGALGVPRAPAAPPSAVAHAPAVARSGPAPAQRSFRVLMVVHMFPPYWWAGVEVYTYQLAKTLRASGHEVSVFFPLNEPSARGCEIRRSVFDGIPVFTAAHDGKGSDPLNIMNPAMETAFAAVLDEGRFEVVHFHHTMGLSFRLIPLARSRGMRTCMTMHDFWYMCFLVHFYREREHSICSGPDSDAKCSRCIAGSQDVPLDADGLATLERGVRVRYAAAKDCLSSLDHIVSPSRYLAAKFEAFGFVPPGRMEVCPLGLEPVPRLPRASRGASGPRLGFLGTIHPLKNVYLLAEAFRQVRGEVSLTFHGAGREAHISRLQGEIGGDARMTYAGKYTPSELPAILAGLDLVIVCSITENYPLVVREAMSAGVPVLASRVGGIPEIVDDGRDGLLFDPSVPGDLRGRLQEIVDSPSRLENLRAALRPVKSLEADAAEWVARYSRLRPGTAPSPTPVRT